MLASLLILSRKAGSHPITNSLGKDVTVGVFFNNALPLPQNCRSTEVAAVVVSATPDIDVTISSTRTRRTGGEEDHPAD